MWIVVTANRTGGCQYSSASVTRNKGIIYISAVTVYHTDRL